ncbi:hypothetical protein [Nitrosomonas communis]|uniref:Uncharacterized protein n=1 Tax=Nitrosomonas communis TaxID=44574 RepID=A0A1I4XCH2_9PROT|nr:hypothetical protein [Nitrosomonas communis]SFN23203.1 hypothetical protein SAMN05421863_11485 [Nitrosomonas communis]
MMNSKVLPDFYYRDPAEVIERVQLNKMGCKACAMHTVVMSRVMCGDARNERQVGVPGVGHKCKWFIERK